MAEARSHLFGHVSGVAENFSKLIARPARSTAAGAESDPRSRPAQRLFAEAGSAVACVDVGPLGLKVDQSENWWRRGELNPCPRSCPRKLLHVYPVLSFKGPNVAPAHCRPSSIHEIPSPFDAVAPPND